MDAGSTHDAMTGRKVLPDGVMELSIFEAPGRICCQNDDNIRTA